MPDNIQPLPDRADLCRMRIEQCAEIIKQLRGFTPDGFKFTFTIGSATIAGFDIDERESWFVIAFFMAWHDFYKKELKRLTTQAA